MYIYVGAANLVGQRALPWVTYVSGATRCACLELRVCDQILSPLILQPGTSRPLAEYIAEQVYKS